MAVDCPAGRPGSHFEPGSFDFPLLDFFLVCVGPSGHHAKAPPRSFRAEQADAFLPPSFPRRTRLAQSRNLSPLFPTPRRLVGRGFSRDTHASATLGLQPLKLSPGAPGSYFEPGVFDFGGQ
jgi:hypothetical protein